MGLWDAVEEIAIAECEISNKYLDDKDEGMNFLTRLLAINAFESELEKKLAYFEELIHKDYIEFANKEDLPNEAEVYEKLLKLKEKVQELIKFPFLTGKNIVAVGGGFSAGKSRFINSILGEEILPTDTRPTTSIPTYIASGNDTKIYSFNIFGSKTEIDEEGVLAISHAFYEKYKLSFTKILKNVLLQSKNMPYAHMVLLDTPGYTKADFHKKEDNTDEAIAKEHLMTADYLIWLVDIEKGTIPQQDLEFIKALEFEKPIFFVFTKGDKKEISDIKAILEVAQKNIRQANIKIEGITAYSSIEKKEYVNRSLYNFLDKANAKKQDIEILDEITQIFDVYRKYNKEKLNHKKKQLALFNKFAIFSEKQEEKEIIDQFRNQLKEEIKKEKHFSENITTLENKFKNAGMDIIKEISKDMKKGQNVNVTRTNPKLNKIVVELGWDTNLYDVHKVDLDVSVFLLDHKEKIVHEEDFVFYNNLQDRNGSVVYTGDSKVGKGKAKQVEVYLDKVLDQVQKIVFVTSIYEAEQRGQNFGQISNAFIRIFNEETKEEILRYNLGKEYSFETTLVFGELFRSKNEWKFNAIGKGSNDGLRTLCEAYGLEVY